MRTLLAVLLLCAVGVGARWRPPDSPEIRTAIERATEYHRRAGTLTPALRAEIRRHAWDAWAAAHSYAAVYGQDPVALFRLYWSTAMLESRVRVDGTHDRGVGLGPISITTGELDAAACRRGILRRGASARDRRRLLERSWRDRTLLVRLSVEHVAHRVSVHGGVIEGLGINSGALSIDTWVGYLGDLEGWHRWIWGRPLPDRLTRPAPAK